MKAKTKDYEKVNNKERKYKLEKNRNVVDRCFHEMKEEINRKPDELEHCRCQSS